MTYLPPPNISTAQLEHERRQRVESGHDLSSCVCCCVTCDPDYAPIDEKEGETDG